MPNDMKYMNVNAPLDQLKQQQQNVFYKGNPKNLLFSLLNEFSPADPDFEGIMSQIIQQLGMLNRNLMQLLLIGCIEPHTTNFNDDLHRNYIVIKSVEKFCFQNLVTPLPRFPLKTL